MIAFDDLNLTEAKIKMMQIASLLGYSMKDLDISELPKIDKRQEGTMLYWKATMNDAQVGNRLMYVEGATQEGIEMALVQSVAWMITAHARPERDLIGQVIVAFPYSQGDLLQAAIAMRVIDYIDKIPQGVMLPGSTKMFTDIVKDTNDRLSKTIVTLRAVALTGRQLN